MPGDSVVRIKILWDDLAAKRQIIDFQQTNARAQKQMATDAKVSAEATLAQARTVEALEKATLALSRADLATTQATQASARASTVAADNAVKEAKARDAAAAAATRQAAAADRARVSGENRQHRDETSYIRDEKETGQRRIDMASQVADGGMVVGAATLGGLAYAGEQAGKFDATLTKMRNNTVLTQTEFDTFKAHIISMGTSTGASMDQMAAAFMRAKNHGFDTAESIKVVDAATRSALATGADIEQTANVLAQTMHIFGLNANMADKAMATLHMAQLQGNTTMEEFVQNFGLAEAVTSKYGLTLQDTAAITATMTENGLNMAEAGTQIRGVMQHLTAPTKSAREEIEKLSARTGIDLVGDIQKLQAGTGSLSKTMIDLSAATGGNAVEINKLIPAQRGAFGAMALTGKASVDLKANFGQLGDTMSGKLDPVTGALAIQQGQLQASTDRLNNRFEVLYVKLGTSVIPVLEQGATVVGNLLDKFNALDPEAQSATVHLLAGAGALVLVSSGAVRATTGILNLVNGLKMAGIGFGAVTGAAEGATAAETVTATTGAALLGTGGIYVAAIGVAVVAIGSIIIGWNQAKEATNQAADAAKRYANQQKTVQGQGELGQLAVNQQQIAEAKDTLKDQIQAQIAQRALIAKFEKKSDGLTADNFRADMQSHPDTFGDTSNGGLAKMQARLTQLDTDYKTEAARSHQLVAEGAGTGQKNLLEVGGDGFAKSVMGVSPDTIKTAAVNSCAEFVSKVFRQAGDRNLPVISGAKALADKVLAMGGKEHSGPALPGDLVLYHGPKFGGRREGGGRSGYHVSYALGGGYDEESSDGRVKRGNIAGNVKWGGAGTTATFITVPGSTFASPGAAGAAGGAGSPVATSKYHGEKFGGDDDKSKAASQAAALLVERVGLKTDDAKRAYDKAAALFEQTHSLTYLAAAESLRRAQADREIAAAKAEQGKQNSGKDPDTAANGVAFERKKKDIEAQRDADLKNLEEKVSGTPEQRRKAVADLAMALLDRKVQAADQAVQRLEALAEASSDPRTAGSLQAAYLTQSKAQMTALRAGLKNELAEIPATTGNAAQRHLLITKEQNEEMRLGDTLSANLAGLDEKRATAGQRLLTVQKDALATQMAITQATLDAAQTEAARKPLRDQAHQERLKDLLLTRQASLAGVDAKYDPLVDRALSAGGKETVLAQKRKAAQAVNDQYAAGVTTENLGSGKTELDAANQSAQTRADRLRTEAGLTDDLAAKMDKLGKAFDILIAIEPDPASQGLLRAQRTDEQNRLGIQRDGQAAQRGLAAGVLASDPKQITAALDQLKALTTDSRANLQEKQSARGAYQTATVDLASDKQLPARDAISRILAGQKDMTAPEIAGSVAAARRILDAMLTDQFKDIGEMRRPSDRKKALKEMDASITGDPLYRAGDLGKDAHLKIKAQEKQGGTKTAVDDFFAQVAGGASQAAPEIMQILFHQKKHQSIFKAFWTTFSNAGESAVSGLLSKLMQAGATSALTSLIPGGSIIGKLLHFSEGGVVPGHGSTDTVPAMLMPGEVVLSHKMIAQMRGGTGYAPRPPALGATGMAALPAPASRAAGTSASGPTNHIDMDVNYHNPHFHNDLDIDKANTDLARKIEHTLSFS